MGPLDFAIHLANFAAPALGMALLLPLLARFRRSRQAFSLGWPAQVAVNFTVGAAILGAGLWHFRHDGMMVTYAVLAVAVATSQWVMERGWRG